MKAIKKILAVTVVFAMMLAVTACSAYAPASEYKNVEINGLKMDVRSDMEFDNSQKNAQGETVEQYYCNYFCLTVTSEPAAIFKQSGCENASDYLNAVIEANNLKSTVEKSGDKVYVDYTKNVDGTDITYTAYGLELGYNYYMVQFFAKSGEEDLYRDEYNKIMDTVELAEVPAETKEIVIDGVKMTVAGDVELQADSQYYGGDYIVTAFTQDVKGASHKVFAENMLKIGNFVKEDGTAVTEVQTIDEEISFYENYMSNVYVYNYAKNVDSNIVYVAFTTMKPADDTLKAHFVEVIKSATVA